MYKILDKTASKLGLERKRKELRRIDLTYYNEAGTAPIISVEHENGYKGIWKEEIPKLLSSNAELKVLICYPPKRKYWEIARRFEKLLNRERGLKRFSEEFLLIMGLEENLEIHDASGFVIYNYTPAFRVRRLKY